MQRVAVPVLGLLTLAALGAGCGGTEPMPGVGVHEAARPILSGTVCGATRLGAAVVLIIDAELEVGGNTSTVRHGCSGALIASDVVMTAASCLDADTLTAGSSGATLVDTRVVVSFATDVSTSLTGAAAALPAITYEASGWTLHPEFDGAAMAQQLSSSAGAGAFKNLALVFLDEAVQAVAPADLLTPAEGDQLVAGAAVEIAGWGATTTGGTAGGAKYCANTALNDVAEWEIQVGSGAYPARKCNGDSGAPTFMMINTVSGSARRLVGIGAHLHDGSSCSMGGWDTRVDKLQGWIDTALQAGCDDGLRPSCAPSSGGDGGPGGNGGQGAPSLPPGGPGCAQLPAAAATLAWLLPTGLLRRRRR